MMKVRTPIEIRAKKQEKVVKAAKPKRKRRKRKRKDEVIQPTFFDLEQE